jgi:cytochrome c5
MDVRRPALLLSATLLAACGSKSSGTSATGEPTATTVAQCTLKLIGQPTWGDFASTFFTSYCTRCHSSTLTGLARNGAPVGHDFDTYAGATQFLSHIDETAAANPMGTVTNTRMPKDPPFPTLDDRKKLACWIAGGAPQ